MTSSTRRRERRSQRVEVYVHDTPLGQVTMAASARGVVRVLLPGTPVEVLLRPVLRRFPRLELARVTSVTPWLEPGLTALAAQLEGSALQFPALDIEASDFERAVWDAVREISRGETRSYREIAQAIGQPNASRAVGQACSANPLPILVPCHRVVGHRGSLVGFGGGLDMKARLLAQERVLLT